jgi:glutamate dehydrogenase/leucine dehydrogenase
MVRLEFDRSSTPQLIIIVYDDNKALLGYLVIDSLINEKCSGGIRLAHDITLDEVIQLARAMTLKFAFKSDALGGAKAGIVCPIGVTKEQKEEILKTFGRKIGPMMRTIYLPGGDIGVGPQELDTIKKAGGLDISHPPAWDKSGFFTAYGVYSSVITVVRKLGLSMTGCTFAIEGYGSVGRPLVKLLHQAGSKILAVSTIEGTIYNIHGLDIRKFERIASQHGDKAIHYYPGAITIRKSDLFTLDVDVVIPGARAWTINKNNVNDIKARAIVPAANIPVTHEAIEILAERGITFIPDFVSTGGGVMGCSLYNIGYPEDDVLEIMERIFDLKLSKIIELSDSLNSSIYNLSILIARQKIVVLRIYSELKRKKIGWFLEKIRQDLNMNRIYEKIAAYLYTKFARSHYGLVRILKPSAILHVVKKALDDVSNYLEWVIGEGS